MDIEKNRGEDILKFINISSTKLKVVLTPKECIKYGIDTSKSDYSRAEIKGVIHDIIAIAEDQCDFSITTDKILVQLYPMPSGECELFVTKLNGLSKKDRDAISGCDGLTMLEKDRGLYRFDSKDIMISAVKSSYRQGVKSDLYIDNMGRYYISVIEELTDGISEFESFIEFGERLVNTPACVLLEYCELLVRQIALDKVYTEDF